MTLKGIFWSEGSNGLGVGPMWLRRWLPCRERFYKAARTHDECYDTLGDGDSRKIYDLIFLCACISASQNAFQRILSYIYYFLVRAFGWMFYRYNHSTP